MRRIWALVLALILILSLAGCGGGPKEDGTYVIEATLDGGSGRARIEAASVTLSGGTVTARITWSSPFYDYMIVDGVRYEPVNQSGNSVFEFPAVLDQEMPVQADTVAMSQPYLIDYRLTLDSKTMRKAK